MPFCIDQIASSKTKFVVGGEATKNYVQGDKTCIYLNAIVNADGDLNIYGVDAQGEFVIFDKVQTRTGKQIASYTELKYIFIKLEDKSPLFLL